jgi:hypothetical protein
MKYLCLIYQDEAEIDAMPEQEYDAILREVLDYRQELQERGNYVASSPLQSAQTATTIRVRNGKVMITDGPFAETREQIGGFYLIEATDLNDAIRVVSRMPPARIASIEVRPLKTFPQELVDSQGESWGAGRD